MLVRMRALLVRSVLISLLIVAGLPVSAQNLGAGSTNQTNDPSHNNPESVLAQMAALSDIQAPGAQPFVMIANVHVVQEGRSADGVYAVSWESARRYRRIIRLSSFTAVEVADGTAEYHTRSTQALPLLVWQLGELMNTFADHGRRRTEARE